MPSRRTSDPLAKSIEEVVGKEPLFRDLQDLVEEHLRDNPIAERPEGEPPDWGAMPRRRHYSVLEHSPLDDLPDRLPNGEINWQVMGRKGAVARAYYKRNPEAKRAKLEKEGRMRSKRVGRKRPYRPRKK